MSGFSKILIANRGEIACRIVRTARAMGYRTVAVYTDNDRGMPHTRGADQAVLLGESPYLFIPAIIAAARRAGADAIHPGYGFLSENADFAEACAGAGLTFIGPSAEAIRLMGNKAAAKRRMAAAGIPCIPGYDGEDQSDAALARAAAALGFPLMVKAAAGGGGRGMRLVADNAGLPNALRAARAEAEKAFGSGELILEKAVAEPRHVEVQVFADSHGSVIHLFERDCSIQRRHQKVIEEAPSPAVSPTLRQAMGAVAVEVAQAIGYVGAGTIEFLLTPDGSFYFLEMNTRLQVEHPVTEMVTGLDLVALQLRVAAGERLPLCQEDVTPRGHAIEARLYAEDAHGDFLPQAGTLLAWEPPGGAGIRVDHGLEAGAIISSHYDSMMAKIIAHGATREEARRRLIAALCDLTALGLQTNRHFLIDCLFHPAFAANDISTAFIERHFPPAARARRAPEPRMTALAAALIDERGGTASTHWHSSGPSIAPLVLACGEARMAMTIMRQTPRQCRVSRAGASHDIEIVSIDGTSVRFVADGLEETARFAWDGDTLHLSLGAATTAFTDALRARSASHAGADGGAALAPMTGTISAVRVKPGDAVRKGQCLVILEAMKMEHEIVAPRDGTIATVLVAPGEQVMTRKLLVELASEVPA